MYQKRAERLLGHGGFDAALIVSPKNLYYYSGFTGGEAQLVLGAEERLIFTDSRYFIQAKEEAKGFKLMDISKETAASFLAGSRFERIGYEDEFLSVSSFEKLKDRLSDKALTGIGALVQADRQIKDQKEIGYIREAARLADEGFAHILPFLRVGAAERDIALELEFFMRKNGAEGLSFETICASGPRSAMPHGTASGRTLQTGDFITLDFGCLYRGYASDMTRTVVMGKASSKQKEVYNTVLSAQKAALAMLSPGVRAQAVDAAARETITKAGYGQYFGHALGHSLGLDIHESPSLSPRSEAVLAVGMLTTVEPGIYIEDFGGVRIEDLALITDNGYENFTSSGKELLEL